MNSLEHYRQLLARVDRFSAAVGERFGGRLNCRRGCDSCCTHIGVLPVEAIILARAVAVLPEAQGERIRVRARRMASGGDCPLLLDGSCLLYEVRPVICRTQGLPLLVEEEGGRRVDHCPRNFQGLDSLPGAAILDLETLNRTLVGINLLCLEELGEDAVDLPERLALAEALLLEIVPSP